MNDLRFLYRPMTLSAFAVGFGILAYIAMSQDVLEEGRDKRRV
jgi:phosphatidylserine synthase 2